MQKALIECLYCGKRWEDMITSYRQPQCSDCKEKKMLKIRLVDESKVDYYKGSPPFPKKEEEDNFGNSLRNWHD